MSYPHKITVVEIPVPPKNIQVKIETNAGEHIHIKEFYATPEEFLEFWKPLVEYYDKMMKARKL